MENKDKLHAKGQVSVELLVIMGFVVLLIMPVLFTLYLRSTQANEMLGLSQADIAATRLANTINIVGTATGSSIITEILVPNGVGGVSVGQREVVIKVSTQLGQTEVVKQTRFNTTETGLSKLSSPGTYMVEVKSTDTGVALSLVN